MNSKNALTAMFVAKDDQQAETPLDVNEALTGFSEDEALEWAIENDVDLDVATSFTDFDHMVGCVLSAARMDDDHVAIVVGLASVATDLHSLEDADFVPVDYSDGDTLVADLPVALDADSAELDNFFEQAAAENEHLAEAPGVEESFDFDEDAEFDFVEEDAATVTTTIDAPSGRRVGRRAVLIGALCIFVLVGLLSSLGNGSRKNPLPVNASAAAPIASAPKAVKAKPKAKPAARRHKATHRKARQNKRRRATVARPSTPQAAPRSVVPAPQPARPSGGSCGSRSSEFSFEC